MCLAMYVRVVGHWNRLPRAAVDAGQVGWGSGHPGLWEGVPAMAGSWN